MSRFYRHIPIINLAVASSALTFQITVLYPWHHQISAKIDSWESKMIRDSTKK